jgi:hypothetical protein
MELKLAGKTVAKQVLSEEITSRELATVALVSHVSNTRTGIGEIRQAAKAWINKKPERREQASKVKTEAMAYLMG